MEFTVFFLSMVEVKCMRFMPIHSFLLTMSYTSHNAAMSLLDLMPYEWKTTKQPLSWRCLHAKLKADYRASSSTSSLQSGTSSL